MEGSIRNSSSALSVAANSAMPGTSSEPEPDSCPPPRGSRSAPSTRQASESGMFTANTVRQPPNPISSPPRVGPTTAMVCAEIASAVSTPFGLSRPVRRDSLRIRCIAAG
ncbi:hypothetical protein GCM10020366_70440 [Saccharopolyspora gregorii]|uniref:Uncharacterized protein n=1 Tax=Saccharopolyspora gregorii TaxID=33914 RepID=A0ABP6S2M5_9PSEU